MPQYAGILFAIAFIAFVVIAFTRAIQRERQRIAEKSQLLSSLGYQIADPPNPEFVRRVIGLRSRWGHDRFRVRFCAVRQSWDYTASVFDLWRTGKNTRLAGENSVAFVSSKLQLPRFSLIPRMELSGFVSGLVDSLTTKLVAQRGGRVEFPGNPVMQEKFIVTGGDHDAIRATFSGQVADFFNTRNHYQMEADNDMLLISAAEFGRRKVRQSPEDLQKTIAETTAFFELLTKK